MDDTHPVAWYLEQFFGDEPDDAVAVLELSQQLGDQPELARRLQGAWADVLERRDADAAVALVERFANRDVGASPARALEWLTKLYERLQPLWKGVAE